MQRIASLLLVTLTAGGYPLAADWPSPRMVADLSATFSLALDGPAPFFTPLGDATYFFASDGVHGGELWRTDFTAGGTSMVVDLCPGNCNGGYQGRLTVWKDALYFLADDGSRGRNLWRSDGTAGGTQLVYDFAASRRFGACDPPVALDSFLLISANDGGNGCALWRSDGTPQGTWPIADPDPDVHPWASGPREIRQLSGDTALFGAGDSLWRTDGTAAGTFELASVRVRGQVSLPGFGARVIDGIYYFFGDHENTGHEAWRSDGSAAGTQLLADAYPGTKGSTGNLFLSLGDRVFFRARTAEGATIWSTTGTPGSTLPVWGPVSGYPNANPRLLNVAGSRLYFAAYDASNDRELWSSDGTTAGTQRVIDLNPTGDGISPWSLAADTTALGDRLIFWGDDGQHGVEPWITDGIEEGTQLLADIMSDPEFPSRYPASLARTIDDQVLFWAIQEDAGGYFFSPWLSDGTPPGTRELAKIDQQTSAFISHSYGVAPFGPRDRQALIIAWPESSGWPKLWTSTGAPKETTILDPFAPDEHPFEGSNRPLPSAGGKTLFATQGVDGGLWATDGTLGGSERLFEGSISFEFERFGNSVFATLDEHLVQTDGTLLGTRTVGDLTGLASVAETAGQGLLRAFTPPAEHHDHDLGVWFLPAEMGEPSLLLDLGDGDSSHLMGAALANDVFLGIFLADLGDGWRLIRTDGTPQGTEPLLPLAPCEPGPLSDLRSVEPTAIPYFQGRFVFCGNDGTHGEEIWSSDGTLAGTSLLADLEPGPLGSHPSSFKPLGNSLFFVAQTSEVGRELWRWSGQASPVLVEDLHPGSESSIPQSLTAHGQTLLFTASTPEHGLELRGYRWDAFDPTIQLVHDINPGPASSSPIGLALGEGRLWFAATDGVHGFEPWVLELDALFVDGFESGDMSRWTGSP